MRTAHTWRGGPYDNFETLRYIAPSIAQFIAAHPRGHFIVSLRGHFAAVCDGVLHDWHRMTVSEKGVRQISGARRQVLSFWQLV